MGNLNSVGNQIKQTRLNKNMTMDYVAKEVGITRTTLFAIEKGDSNYSINNLIKVMDFLGLSFSIKGTSVENNRSRATRLNTKLDKKINRFVIMCVEMYAKYKNMSAHLVYSMLNRKKVIRELTEDYEDLHSMGTEWINNYIDSLVS